MDTSTKSTSAVAPNPVHVIAEAGTNHNGQLAEAYKLAELANRAGANSVKFQLIYPEGLYLPKFFENGCYTPNEVYAKRVAGALSDDEYRKISTYCLELGIPFSASVFDKRGVDFLLALDVPYLKIASCDLNNLPLLRYAAEQDRTLVLSTGMSTLGEIERSVETIVGAGSSKLVLMHCVSIYPAKLQETNLAFLTTLKTAFGFPIGFSDHTKDNTASSIAVALGATWLEKHFTLDSTQEGFDHAYAQEPQGFCDYVACVRDVSQAIVPKLQKVGESEQAVSKRARRSLYAARDIESGESLTLDDILIVRPCAELEPADLTKVLGATVVKAIRQFESISWSKITRA